MKRINVFSNGGVIKNKKYIISLFIALFGILSLFGGTSYAILKGINSDSNEQVIKTGSVKLKLTENYETINKKISIMGDEEGLLQEETYDFNLKNIGSSPAKYDLKLINEVPSSYTGKVLDTKYIKVGLEINGEEYGPMSLEKVKNVIDSDIIYKNEIINYKLRIWLDKSKEEEISKLEDYKAFLKLRVDAEQRSDSMDTKDSVKTFNYTGDVQEYTVPRDGYYYIEIGGAAGGSGSNGAKVSGYVELKAKEKLYFYVGKRGTDVNTNCRTSGYEFNGGGIALPGKSGICGPTGGGATDVRLVGGSWNNTSSLISRIMVAGAGGGTSDNKTYTVPYGGTLYGVKPRFVTYQANIGVEGTQKTGGAAPTKDSCAQSTGTAGSFGKGGYGGASSATNVATGGGAGGGSGYYGGSGASGLCNGTWPGGGGSSYISGYAGVNSVKESTTITHTNDTLHYSGKYFVGGQMLEGQNSGDGYAKITFVDTKPKKRSTKLNNVRYVKDCISYSTANVGNHWVELQAIKDGINIAKGKSVTGTSPESNTTTHSYKNIVDGDIAATGTSGYGWSETNTTNQCITVDLGSTYDLDEVAVWNYFGDARAYYDAVTYVSSDNKTYNKIIDEDALQTSNGRRINAYTNNYNGYTTENVLLWYDGYANTGETRNTTTTTWKNLANSSYSATVSGATWYDNYLSFDGSNDYAKTNQSLNYNSSKAFTVQFVGTVYEKTAASILFESSVNSNNNTGSYYIDTLEFGKRDITLAMKYGSSYNNHKKGDGILGTNKALYTIIFDSTQETNKYISMYKNLEKWKIEEAYSSTPVAGNIDNKTLSNYVFYIASRAGTSSYSKMDINSLRIYNKALTDDEIVHNYNYDKQRFNLD